MSDQPNQGFLNKKPFDCEMVRDFLLTLSAEIKLRRASLNGDHERKSAVVLAREYGHAAFRRREFPILAELAFFDDQLDAEQVEQAKADYLDELFRLARSIDAILKSDELAEAIKNCEADRKPKTNIVHAKDVLARHS